MNDTEENLALGQWFFRWRSYFPLVLLPAFVAAAWAGSRAETLFGHANAERWEDLCRVLAAAGLLLRAVTVGFAPSGTSGRNVKAQRALALNTSGMYSLMRHPLYSGNFLIWAGLLLFLCVWWLAALGVAAFFLYYGQIIRAEETFLQRTFGAQFDVWATETPAYFPSFSRWRAPETGFSWLRVARREYPSLFATVFCFFFLETAEDSALLKHFRLEPIELVCVTLACLVWLVLRQLKKSGLLRA